MSEVKVSELEEATSVNDEDLLMIVQNGVNKKVPASKVGTGGGTVSGDTSPIGAIMEFTSDTIPTNWLLCDGREISRTTYSDLFNVIGTTYGPGDGSTTFNLPDRKGVMAIGKDPNDPDFDALGKTGGEKTHTLTVNELPSHKHRTWCADNNYSEQGDGYTNYFYGKGRYYNQTDAVGGNQPHNNMPPNIVENFIIKAFQSSGVVADVAQVDTDSDTDVYSCNYINKKVIGEVIYDNPQGANDDIIVTKEISNFKYIEFYYGVPMGNYFLKESKRIEAVDGCDIALTSFFAHSDALQINNIGRWHISGKSITKMHETSTRFGSANDYTWDGTSARTLISKIIGYY